MARRKSKTLTEVELEFMQIIWSRGEATTEDVIEALRLQRRNLAGGTVRKMLAILVDKGYLSRRRRGQSFLYKAKVSEEKATKKMAVDLVKRAFGGKAAPMLAALMSSRSMRKGDIDEIKRLIAAAEEEGRK